MRMNCSAYVIGRNIMLNYKIMAIYIINLTVVKMFNFV
jgi:hypothetical protein